MLDLVICLAKLRMCFHWVEVLIMNSEASTPRRASFPVDYKTRFRDICAKVIGLQRQ